MVLKSGLRKLGALVAGFLLAVAANCALAQPGPGPGYGMGPGTMGGYGGYGMGPGMMGGYGGYGMGPGYGGYGMGPGMMGGWGMGPGWSGRWGAGLDLTADQRQKIDQIRSETRSKNWALMGKMMDARYKLAELYDAEKPDTAAIVRQYKEIDNLRLQMIEGSVDAHNRIDAVLTSEQKEKARERGWGPMMGAY
jgi:Spy/CpxP family protein refolding chaperone